MYLAATPHEIPGPDRVSEFDVEAFTRVRASFSVKMEQAEARIPQESHEARLSMVKAIIMEAVTEFAPLIGVDSAKEALITAFRRLSFNMQEG